jgi:hypothetical protein
MKFDLVVKNGKLTIVPIKEKVEPLGGLFVERKGELKPNPKFTNKGKEEEQER